MHYWVAPQETTTSSKQSRSATKCVLKTISSWCWQTNASSPLNRVHGEISANLCFFTMLSNIYQPIFVYFNALRYISANLCLFQCSQIYISQPLFTSMLLDIYQPIFCHCSFLVRGILLAMDMTKRLRPVKSSTMVDVKVVLISKNTIFHKTLF